MQGCCEELRAEAVLKRCEASRQLDARWGGSIANRSKTTTTD